MKSLNLSFQFSKTFLLCLVLLFTSALFAEDEDTLATLRSETDLLWMIIAAVLVFFMQAGFAYVEAGFTRAKNAVNILSKNLADFFMASLSFWLVGFSIMFGPLVFAGLGFGMPGIADSLLNGADGKPNSWNYGFLLFQMVFAGTSATIVSGAMAERTKFSSYLIFSFICSALIYPVFGSFAWSSLLDGENAGFLAKMGFIDFAGSTVVHSLGGWMGLAGAIVLGPRMGKYPKEGGVTPIFGHNMAMAALGVFILWFGWFGFNPGSTTSVGGGSFAIIAVTTNMAAIAGGIGATITAWILFRRPDISMVLNGVLAGLVAITSPCYNVDILSSVIIGLVAGIIVVFSVLFFDKIRIDDPVGAISVHGVAGAWGTLAAGLFANPAFGDGTAGLFFGGGFSPVLTQLIGIAVAFVWGFGAAFLVFFVIKVTLGLRVSVDEEIEGLDILEHGNEAYPDQEI